LLQRRKEEEQGGDTTYVNERGAEKKATGGRFGEKGIQAKAAQHRDNHLWFRPGRHKGDGAKICARSLEIQWRTGLNQNTKL